MTMRKPRKQSVAEVSVPLLSHPKSQSTESTHVPDSTTKNALEMQKLLAEITNLRKRFWIPAAIQATPAFVLVLLTIYLAGTTGVLDAKRDVISAQNEHLKTEKLFLEQDKADVGKEIAALTVELAQTKNQVVEFQREKDSIKTIRKLLPASTIEYFDDDDGFHISLVPHVAYKSAMYPATETTPSPHTVAALAAVGKIQDVRSLEIRGLTLEKLDLMELAKLTTLTDLVLAHNGLDNGKMADFPVFPEMTQLCFVNQRFTSAPTIGKYPCLKGIKLFSTPVSDELIHQLLGCGSTLEFIGLHETAITDESIRELTRFKKLNNVLLVKSSATIEGVRALASMPSMRFLSIDRNLFTEELALEFKQNHPEVSFGPHD